MTKRKFNKVVICVVLTLVLFAIYLIWSYLNTWIGYETAYKLAMRGFQHELKINGMNPDDYLGPNALNLPSSNVASFQFVWQPKLVSGDPIAVSVDRQSLEVKVYRETSRGFEKLNVK